MKGRGWILGAYLVVGLGLSIPSEVIGAPRGCTRLLPANDGAKRGFLWKQSNDYPGAVVLVPTQYKFASMNVKSRKGKVLDTLRYFYPYSEDGSMRPVWRAKKRAAEFPRDSFVVGAKKGERGRYCWRLRKPSERID